MNAKDFMKIAGVKSEKEFYKKYPTEEAFFEAFPDAMQYKKGGKIKKKFKPQDSAVGYREFPPNVMQMGGAIQDTNFDAGYTSPYEESQFNVTNQAKRTGRVMSKAENAGMTALDVVVGATKFIHGQDVKPSEMSGKVNPYSGKQGSWYSSGGNKTEMPKAAQDKIMGAMQGTGDRSNKGPGSQEAGSPTGGEAPAESVGGDTSIGGPAAGASIGAPSMGNMMAKYGGPVQMNMGGMMPNLSVVNSPDEFGATLRAYGGNIRDTYSTGYINPTEEGQFNNDLSLKKFDTLKQMTSGENVGWTVADILTSPVSSFTGKNLSELASNKANPHNNKRGSWWGGIEGTYVKPAVQSFLADSNIPYVSQIAGMGRDVRNVVAPMLIDKRDDPERLQKQAMMGQIGSSVGGAVGGMMGGMKGSGGGGGGNIMGSLMGGMMGKYGGNLKMDMGGAMPALSVTNSPDEFGATLRQYGGDLKFQMGGNMPQGTMGLNELMGPTHEEGGMAISPEVEVEGGETILEPESYVFSDSIKVPGKKKTFAQESKTIKNKYKMREDDKLSQEAMKAELETLMNEQEEVREAMMISDTEKFQNKMQAKYGGLMPEMNYPVDRNMQPVEYKSGGGIHIKPSKKGTFTAAAKKRGMGVQEFASKVMANKEDYSSAMIKKANFAKNAAKWKHEDGGKLPEGILKSRLESHMSPEEVDAYLTHYAMGGNIQYGGKLMGDTGIGLTRMYDDGGKMGIRKASKIASNFQDSPIFSNPEDFETIGVEGNQIYGRSKPGGEDEYIDFKNEKQARRFLNTLESGKLDSFIKNDFKTPDNDKKPFDPDMLRIPTTAIAGLSAGLKGLGKQKFYPTPQAKMNYINTRPAEILAERQGELALAAGLGALRSSPTTQGNYLANVANMAATSGIGTGANVANIKYQGDTQNVGLANQAALQRQATIAANNAARTQFDTAQMLRRDKILEDMNKIGQTGSMDTLKAQNQNLLLSLMAQDRVKYDSEGNLYVKTIDPNTKKEEWVLAKP